jgi:hypothetical protein
MVVRVHLVNHLPLGVGAFTTMSTNEVHICYSLDPTQRPIRVSYVETALSIGLTSALGRHGLGPCKVTLNPVQPARMPKGLIIYTRYSAQHIRLYYTQDYAIPPQARCAYLEEALSAAMTQIEGHLVTSATPTTHAPGRIYARPAQHG